MSSVDYNGAQFFVIIDLLFDDIEFIELTLELLCGAMW